MLERKHIGLLVKDALGGHKGRVDGTPLDNIRGTASFILPLDDVGDGTVNTTLARGTGSATFTRSTAATTRQWKPYYLSTGERVTLDLDFTRETLVPQVGSQTVAFTRSGVATRVNSSGLIETVAVDTPRYDYDKTTLLPKGLLIEEGRTNICLQSADWSVSAPWAHGGVTVTPNATTAPDGTVTGNHIICILSGGSKAAVQGFTASVSRYTVSFWVKAIAGGRTNFSFGLHDGSFAAATGTILEGPGAISGTGLLSVTGLSDDQWTRVALTTDNNLTATLYNLFVYPGGSGESLGHAQYFWGCQIEAGLFATSYIPTTSASVARGSDNVSIAALGSWFNAVEGTMYVEGQFDQNHFAGGGGGLFLFDDGTTNEYVGWIIDNGGTGIRSFRAIDGAVAQVGTNNGGGGTAGVVFRMAGAYKANDFAASDDGGAVEVDGAATLPTVTKVSIGSFPAANNHIGAHIRRILYSPQRIVNANLITLSTSTPTLVSGSNLISVASGSPRSYYTPTGTYAGYLAEGARTNLCLRSEELDNASWTGAATVTANSGIAPDGTVTADELTDDDAGNFEGRTQNITVPNDNATYIISVFVQKTTALPTPIFGMNIGLSGGVSVSTTPRLNTVSGQNSNALVVEDWGTHWRLSASITNNTSGNVTLGTTLYPATRTSADETVGGADTITGVGSAKVWGVQVEVAAFLSSYIPTTTIAVARNADVLSYPLANINQAEGAAYADCHVIPYGRTIYTGIFLGGASNGYMLYGGVSQFTHTAISDGNTPNAIANALDDLSTAVRKRISTWGTSYKAVTGNGVAVTSTANYHGTLGTTPTLTLIGTSGSGDQPYGTVKNVRMWNRRLPDTILQQLTR